ncbi:MAG: glycosyltransferase [Planctomycetes bacterium]|nr:glycosyltransferase [Planctomycetota bacterium]MCC7170850.1 glycosyltransferase [Planctomycetota bacterium]
MRVARILGRANVGGPIKTVLALCRRLRAHGVTTRLFVGPSSAREGDRLVGVDDVEIVRVPELRRGANPFDLLGIARLRDALREFGPDIVHTHTAKAGLLGRLAAAGLEFRPRIVHTFHGHVLRGYFARPIVMALVALERRLARDSDAIVAVGPRVADDLVDAFHVVPREGVVVIENGIDLEPFASMCSRERARAEIGLDAGARTPCIVVPARLAPIKGHEVLLDALEHAALARRELDVVLLGDGPLRSEIERRARELRARARVHCVGFVDAPERVLPAADLVVLPSLNEGQPLALLEAMAAGVAVLATAVGGVPDLVTDGVDGYLVESADPVRLAQRIAAALDDPAARAAAAARGRSRVFGRSSIDRVVREHLALYERLLHGP